MVAALRSVYRVQRPGRLLNGVALSYCVCCTVLGVAEGPVVARGWLALEERRWRGRWLHR